LSNTNENTTVSIFQKILELNKAYSVAEAKVKNGRRSYDEKNVLEKLVVATRYAQTKH
jgi:hypothetical protein